MPATEMLAAARPIFRTRRGSVSIPVSSSSMRMPSCPTASIMLRCSPLSGKTACCASGQRAPKIEGPSRTPAMSWPMTAGCPMRCIASPSNRPTRSSRTTWVMKMTSEAPGPVLVGACAAHACDVAMTSAAAPQPARRARGIHRDDEAAGRVGLGAMVDGGWFVGRKTTRRARPGSCAGHDENGVPRVVASHVIPKRNAVTAELSRNYLRRVAAASGCTLIYLLFAGGGFSGGAARLPDDHAQGRRDGEHAAPGDEEPAQERHARRIAVGRGAADLGGFALRHDGGWRDAVVAIRFIVRDDRRACARIGFARAGPGDRDDARIGDVAGKVRGSRARLAQLVDRVEDERLRA